MRLRYAFIAIAAAVALFAQRPFIEYPGLEYNQFPLPKDWNQKTDWVRARLRYPDISGYPNRQLFMQNGSAFPGYWTMDYPRSDRHLLTGVRRLTRIDARLSEQVAELDGTSDLYNWPILYAVEVGHWLLPDAEARQLGEYLERGGFLMVDDFHGNEEWEIFVDSMERALPGREIVDLPDSDPIFHTVYDLNERFQVPGAQYFDTGRTYEGEGESGKTPHWRGIYDDKGRVMVAICHNMDLGDAWEVSDEPRYPEKWASLAYRIAMNYFIYDLTH